LIRFGETAGRIVLAGRRADSQVEVSVTLREKTQAKEHALNGARLPSASLAARAPTLVFQRPTGSPS